MSVLITGGFGKTASQLAKVLHEANRPYVIATRKGTAPAPYKAARFDWLDASTYENPFKADPNIDKLYLVSPPGFDIVPVAKPFLEFAINKGVKRAVLLSGAQVEKGDLAIGKVHAYLDSLDIDYVVLRATWFFENLVAFYRDSIRNNNEITSSFEDGKVPHVGTHDIAKAAYEAFFDEAKWPRGRSPRVFGPEPLTFDEVAAILSDVLGRKITHGRISVDPKLHEEGYVPQNYPELMASFEVAVSKGKEERFFYDANEDKYVGKTTFKEFITDNKAEWTI